MVPYELSPFSTTQVQVQYGNVSSNPYNVLISQTAPGIFSADATGRGNVAANNPDGSLNSPTNPAQPGSYITVYLTGEGPTNPPGVDGYIATGTSSIASSVTATIGGTNAQILYAGAAPGNVNGFVQVNLVVPSTVPQGGAQPLTIAIGNSSSQSGITVSVSGPTSPTPQAPTNLNVTSVSASTADLAWVNNDPNASAIRVEVQLPGSSTFQDIGPASSLISTEIAQLQPNTTYSFRVRAVDGGLYSAYSNVVSATTASQTSVLAAPSNLQAIAASSTAANLTWTNNAPTATAIRVEIQTGGVGQFTDIGPAPSFTSFQINSLTPNTLYIFRVRAQQGNQYSDYSNLASITTPSAGSGTPTTIFLVHGILQGDPNSLSGRSQTGVPPPLEQFAYTLQSQLVGNYLIDYGFDWGRCANPHLAEHCPTDCSLSEGAQELGAYITSVAPQGNIILIGYSMGGLLTRDLLFNNYNGVLSNHRVDLITIATPNVGYRHFAAALLRTGSIGPRNEIGACPADERQKLFVRYGVCVPGMNRARKIRPADILVVDIVARSIVRP